MAGRAMRSLASTARCSLSSRPVRVGAVGVRSEAAPAWKQSSRWRTSGSFSNSQEVYRMPAAASKKSDLNGQVKESMRLVAQTMAVITTPVADADASAQSNVIGLVASSFNVVTLSSPGGPIVSFNLKLPSRTFAAISECGQFEVSFPWSAELSQWFLRSPPPPDLAGGESRGQPASKSEEKGGSAFVPKLMSHTAIASASKPETLLKLHRTFAYRCDWLQEQSVTVGDHIIMIGQVKEFILGDTVDAMRVRPEQLPINYRDGKFLKLKKTHKQAGFFEYSSSVAEEML